MQQLRDYETEYVFTWAPFKECILLICLSDSTIETWNILEMQKFYQILGYIHNKGILCDTVTAKPVSQIKNHTNESGLIKIVTARSNEKLTGKCFVIWPILRSWLTYSSTRKITLLWCNSPLSSNKTYALINLNKRITPSICHLINFLDASW